MIRHASAQPHAVGALPVAMVEPACVAALMPHSRRSYADGTGGRAAGVPAVRLAAVVLAAREERRAAPAAPKHHKNIIHAPQLRARPFKVSDQRSRSSNRKRLGTARVSKRTRAPRVSKGTASA